ncbi:unnamed protein product [Urochloa humidicola]
MSEQQQLSFYLFGCRLDVRRFRLFGRQTRHERQETRRVTSESDAVGQVHPFGSISSVRFTETRRSPRTPSMLARPWLDQPTLIDTSAHSATTHRGPDIGKAQLSLPPPKQSTLFHTKATCFDNGPSKARTKCKSHIFSSYVKNYDLLLR